MAVQPVPYIDTRAVMGLSAVWRAVSLIADTIADMPWQEWRGEELLPTSRLLRRPGPVWMTRREWVQRVVVTEALFNTTYLIHAGGLDAEGAPWSLVPYPNGLVQAVNPDPWGIIPPTEYTVGGVRIPAQYVTVLRRLPLPGVDDRLAGLLEIARRQFTAYVAADVHMMRYWSAGGPTTTVITTDQPLQPNDAKDIQQRWVESRAQGTEWPAVLGRGAHAEPWGADPTTQSGTEARNQMNADIARHFGLPTRIMNAPAGDSETYSNVENDAIDVYRYCLRGYMGPIEDTISTVLPGDYIGGRRLQLDPSRFLQGDLTTRATAWAALVTSGIVTKDEARTKGFGLPPLAQTSVGAEYGDTTVITSADTTTEVQVP